MITILHGDNSFEIEQALRQLTKSFKGTVERIDGQAIELKQLPDILMGSTLFASERMVVLKNLSENKSLWNDFVGWLPRISNDIHLILVDTKLDKRTKTYKELLKIADTKEYKAWTDRDISQAEMWALRVAESNGTAMDKYAVRTLISRLGVNQWDVYNSLQKLAAYDTVTEVMVQDLIDPNPSENVFMLFESALKGDRKKVSQMIRTLEQTDDPFMVFGLLSGQAFQLLALASTDKPSADVAKDIGAHPFVLQKLQPFARKLQLGGARTVVAAFSEADTALKTSVSEPWLLIERALMKSAR